MSEKRKQKKSFGARFVGKILPSVILWVGGIIMIYPLFFGLMGSLTTNEEFMQTTFLPIPKTPFREMRNFIIVFTDRELYTSFLVTVLRLAYGFITTVFTSVLGGYVFARMRFPFRDQLFMLLMVGLMIPGVAMMVPNYVFLKSFPLAGGNNILGQGGSGFINNPLILFIPGLISSYNIFLCKQAFVSMGGEYKEAADVDGAGFLRIVFGIYMPMIKPILAVIFLNSFLGMWNDYMFSLIYLPQLKAWHSIGTVSTNLASYYMSSGGTGLTQYPKVFAIGIVMMIPPVLVYVLMQKQFVQGLTMGGVKG